MNTKQSFSTRLALATALWIALALPATATSQRAQAQANFLKADANQDNQLDYAEFKTFVNLNADQGLGRAPRIRRFGMYGRAFNIADENGDGVVSKQEIEAQSQ
ncbi:EF-hand domain-containing protein [Synechococcus sp. ATX 2A4]|uniref:EF-hand domain-containing protein n=1 Tax=Synechococcus sp. ATX 2A4 TaxID=2823727 RepID=UPI0020CB8AE2|nr:EF-hand domain-containing protein [Synechococcus sp. ATX 2A4]MCP9886257.1 EF-hand domain-containing protein [Synechococcus sp. ATX 2A4]